MLRKIAYSLLRKDNKVCGRFRFAPATSSYSLLRKIAYSLLRKVTRSAVASASRQPPRCIVCFAKIITAYQRTAVITSLQNIKTTLQYLYNRHASGYERHSCALLLYSFITSLTFVFLHKYYGVISVFLPLRSRYNKVSVRLRLLLLFFLLCWLISLRLK